MTDKEYIAIYQSVSMESARCESSEFQKIWAKGQDLAYTKLCQEIRAKLSELGK